MNSAAESKHWPSLPENTAELLLSLHAEFYSGPLAHADAFRILPKVAEVLKEMASENREFRIMLAIAHAGLSLYTDDGELQDNREQPYIDFKRDTASDIEAKLLARHRKRLEAQINRRLQEP